MAAVTAAAYIANQIGNSVKMLLEKYARWIPGSDNGNARAILMAAMAEKKRNSSQIRPKASIEQGSKWKKSM